MKKRMGLLLTLAAVMAALVALSAAGASAQPTCTVTSDRGQFTQTCEETTTETFTQTTSTTQPCQVGNSGRTGTQSGTLTETFQVTTTTTVTTVFQGNPQAGNIISGPTTTTDVGEPVLISSEFTPTGNCRNVPGPQ